MPNYIVPRGNYWTYMRRIPEAYQQFDSRQFVMRSTGITIASDRRGLRAQFIAQHINRGMVTYWEALASGGKTAAKARLDEIVRRARALGYTYMETGPLADSAQRENYELRDRMLRLEKLVAALTAGGHAKSAEPTVAALLGDGGKPTTIPLSALFDEVYKLSALSLKNKPAEPLRNWIGSRKRAIENLVEVIGDKDLMDITRADVKRFRDWWEKRILEQNYKTASANVCFAYLSSMFGLVERHHLFGLQPLFAKQSFKENDEDLTPAFSSTWIREKLLAPGALDGLHPEARHALYVMIETGLRPSEIVTLDRSMIHLNHEHGPHITLHAHGRRQLKNDNSSRTIPLVGVALAAMRLNPDGLTRYNARKFPAGDMCKDINKYLTRHGLRETPDHSLYSLRHSFKDRLRDVNTETELKNMLMGHSNSEERYGNGFHLKRKREALEKIMFRTFPPVL